MPCLFFRHAVAFNPQSLSLQLAADQYFPSRSYNEEKGYGFIACQDPQSARWLQSIPTG